MQLPIYGLQPSSRENVRQKRISALAAFVLSFGALFLAFYLIAPPAPVPSSAPADQFSSDRALTHLQEIAREIHPIGTPAHDRVRDYLVEQLTSLGLETHVQAATVSQGQRPPFLVGQVNNIVAKLKGTADTEKAVVLLSHYDSVTAGHGAGDAGMGVAAVLETVRALTAGPPLKNDVIVLLTDSEEYGLLGVRAYLDEHPWAKDTGVVFNFEGQGPQGPIVMFETSFENGALVAEVRKAVPALLTSSLAYDVFKLLPHSNDFALFRDRGYAGLTTVVLADMALYHSTLDNLDRVDARALQHQGVYGLSLARHFGNLSLPANQSADAVFFNLVGWYVVQYSQTVAIILAVLLAITFLFILMAGRAVLNWKGALGSAGALLLSMAVSGGIVWLVQRHFQLGSEDHRAYLYYLGFTVFTVAVALLFRHALRGTISKADLFAGIEGVWVVSAVIASFLLPGGSYLFQWPAVFMLPVLAHLVFGFSMRGYGNSLLVTAAVCAIPVILLVAPVLDLIFTGMTLDMVVVPVLFVAMVSGLLTPLLRYITDAAGWWVIIGLLVVGTGFVASGLVGEFDAAHPRTYDVSYSLDTNQERSGFVSLHISPSPWVDQFFPAGSVFVPAQEHFPMLSSRSRALYHRAPSVDLAPPWVEIVSDKEEDVFRILELRIGSSRGAPYINLRALSDLPVVEAVVNGKKIPWNKVAQEPFRMRFLSVPEEGFILQLKIGSTAPLSLQVVDQSSGLPEALGVPAPPSNLMPEPAGMDKNSTLVGKTFQL